MTGGREAPVWVEGYEAPIKRALWERILSLGVPRVWATLWMVCCACVISCWACAVAERCIASGPKK